MSWMSGKYLRYILFAIFGLAILRFISSSSLPLPSTSGLTSKIQPPASQDTPESQIPAPPQNPDENPLAGAHDEHEHEHEHDHEHEHSHDEHGPGPLQEEKTQVLSERVNATFVTLARNGDIWDIVESIQHVEDRFNRNYHYDWVFLNDAEFDEDFKKLTTAVASGKTFYGKISKEHWSFPSWIDQKKAARVRESMKQQKVIYGDSISYRHMCRYESGFFFRHDLMMNYDYYWRVEPSVKYYCDIPYDPFKLMRDQKKKYGFVLSLHEYRETVATLWNSVKTYMQKYPEYIVEGNTMEFVSDDKGETYNMCHFWSNFEVGDLNWLRSDAYIKYFEHLDQDGGFFYERWGDAPVHSIAASLLLKKEEIHFFDEIAYWHVPFTHCPTDDKKRHELRCTCKPTENFDWKGYSCTSRFFEINNMQKPPGYEHQTD